MNPTRNKAYFQLLEIADEIRRLCYDRTVVNERYQNNSLIKQDTGYKSSTIKVNFTQMTYDWIPTLTNPSKLFVFNHIVTELKLYNLLWHRPLTKKSSEKAILKELVDTGLLFRTEVNGIYIVNPVRIWRGTIPGAVEATKALLRKHKRPSIELIHDLRSKDEVIVKTSEDHYHQMSDFSTNMLSDAEVAYVTKNMSPEQYAEVFNHPVED